MLNYLHRAPLLKIAKLQAALTRQTEILARNLPDQATPPNNQGRSLAQDLAQALVPDQTPGPVKLAKEWAAAQAQVLRARDRQAASLEDNFR